MPSRSESNAGLSPKLVGAVDSLLRLQEGAKLDAIEYVSVRGKITDTVQLPDTVRQTKDGYELVLSHKKWAQLQALPALKGRNAERYYYTIELEGAEKRDISGATFPGTNQLTISFAHPDSKPEASEGVKISFKTAAYIVEVADIKAVVSKVMKTAFFGFLDPLFRASKLESRDLSELKQQVEANFETWESFSEEMEARIEQNDGDYPLYHKVHVQAGNDDKKSKKADKAGGKADEIVQNKQESKKPELGKEDRGRQTANPLYNATDKSMAVVKYVDQLNILDRIINILLLIPLIGAILRFLKCERREVLPSMSKGISSDVKVARTQEQELSSAAQAKEGSPAANMDDILSYTTSKTNRLRVK